MCIRDSPGASARRYPSTRRSSEVETVPRVDRHPARMPAARLRTAVAPTAPACYHNSSCLLSSMRRLEQQGRGTGQCQPADDTREPVPAHEVRDWNREPHAQTEETIEQAPEEALSGHRPEP